MERSEYRQNTWILYPQTQKRMETQLCGTTCGRTVVTLWYCFYLRAILGLASRRTWNEAWCGGISYRCC